MRLGVPTYSSPEPAALRSDACTALLDSVQGDAAFWYAASTSGEITRTQAVGADAIVACVGSFRSTEAPEGAASSSSTRVLQARRGAWDMSAAPIALRTKFRSLYEDFRAEELFATLAVYRDFYGPLGITGQLRLLPFSGCQSLGWIGVVRTGGEHFTGSDRALADALAPELIGRLTAARALESLEDGAHVVARPRGDLDLCSRPARRWMTKGRADLVAQAVRAADAGGPVACRIDGVLLRFSRLDGREGVRYLATLHPEDAHVLGAASCLTLTERAIALSAAAGLTVGQIAEERAVSANTVKYHLKSTYRKLGVATRVELARAVGNV